MGLRAIACFKSCYLSGLWYVVIDEMPAFISSFIFVMYEYFPFCWLNNSKKSCGCVLYSTVKGVAVCLTIHRRIVFAMRKLDLFLLPSFFRVEKKILLRVGQKGLRQNASFHFTDAYSSHLLLFQCQFYFRLLGLFLCLFMTWSQTFGEHVIDMMSWGHIANVSKDRDCCFAWESGDVYPLLR